MDTALVDAARPAALARFLLRFESLFDPGRGFAFACDERGLVDPRVLSERQRRNYENACGLVGLELGTPWVEVQHLQ